jgi:hypothetical protein
VPLFGGKKRRLGNLRGTFGIGMNHGQVPGETIYKLYTKEEVDAGVQAINLNSDFPSWERDSSFTLHQIISKANNGMDGISQTLTNYLLNGIINAKEE